MSKSKKNINARVGKQINAVPDIVFTPFKINRIIIVILGFISSALCVWLLIMSIIGNIEFSSSQLMDSSNFTVNVNLLIGALGLTILLLPIKSKQNQKEKLLFRFVGNILLSTSIALLGYIFSYCTFINLKIISAYIVIMLLVLIGCLTHTVSTMVAYFNIRD